MSAFRLFAFGAVDRGLSRVFHFKMMVFRAFANQWLFATAFLGAALIGITLFAWGQPLICTCGYIQFWVGSVFSSGNSQHIADWYTLSHIVHGMLIVLFGRLFFPSWSFRTLFLIAIVTGVAWEIVEHTDWVLTKFRNATLYQGYFGDSVLNAVSDYIWMLAGFFLALAIPTGWIAICILCLEITAAAVARDCLALTTLMLVYPVDAVEEWQQELNPNVPTSSLKSSLQLVRITDPELQCG